MRIIIAGGGTGGHVFPGIAVAQEFKRVHKDVEVIFIGTAYGIESKIVPKEGFDIRFIRSEGIVGKNIINTIRAAVRIPISLKDSYKVLKEIKPDLVFGVGGYSSGPALLIASISGIPTMIHEQNAVPGFTNSLLSRFVDVVAVTYQESLDHFPKDKTYITGNPVRQEILHGDKERGYKVFGLDKGLFTIFVFGGSRGASSINKAVTEALVYLDKFKDKIQFLHQTGEKDFNKVRDFYGTRGFKGAVIPFAYNMADAYAVADLVISRAGATTLSELTACGKAAILIPYPYAAGDHQELNAEKLWDIGAAQMLLDRGLNGKSLSELVIYLFENPDTIGEMEGMSKTLGKSDAAQKIVELAMGLIKSKKGGN
ncbi:MAG: undecaprenyldiphospho-muramoylpentapeptide beta-N-acetylglucosaminyltransferase [Nitrospirae bacterium]|nr:undecaprenyldiphospho-muramoylpentapeptide beta-N-acetylglucosaminyltransferase [Nitrospirota bacterium]